MLIFIIVLIVLVAFLLVMVILAQNPKGGLSSQFGGSGTSNLIGVKKTGDLLENITWSLIVVMFVLSLSTNFIDTGSGQEFTSPNVERAQDQLNVPTIDLGPDSDTDTSTPVLEEGSTEGEESSEGQGLDGLTEGSEDQ